ncbi:MAG: tRNA uridine-5-carboxymethylaminomethyl(34) synthesis GTPase MnmE [Armatimonadota bacterium]
MNFYDDTIAAIATPMGDGGIGIIRVSGKSAVTVAGEIFRPLCGIPVAGLPTHTAHYGSVVEPVMGEQIDDGILTIFRAPRSYTGEDTVEISCHGGIVPVRRVLQAALRAGARFAEPGEFSKRAFLNGKIDLAQAEAVLDIIRARTDQALRVARRQFDGALSARIRVLRDELAGIMARIEACIDFPDDVEDWTPKDAAESIRQIRTHVDSLAATADRGRIYREGVYTVITGRPNVGKSSLLNALLRESRAIVTPIPGTTRDAIEETLNIRGVPVRAVDTAGMRETDDPIEQIGVGRAKEMLAHADLVLAVLDASEGLTPDDEALLSELDGRRFIVVLNKSDIIREADATNLALDVQGWLQGNLTSKSRVINTAAPSNEGITELENAIADTVLAGGTSLMDGAMVTNVRHLRTLEEAQSAIARAFETAQVGLPIDLAAIDIRAAMDALGRITGETVAEDVLDRIFSEFCIGK